MKEYKTYLAQLIYYVNFKLLANILSFTELNIIQHIHRTPCTFRNHSQPSIDSRH
jgi:hypothetical protein